MILDFWIKLMHLKIDCAFLNQQTFDIKKTNLLTFTLKVAYSKENNLLVKTNFWSYNGN